MSPKTMSAVLCALAGEDYRDPKLFAEGILHRTHAELGAIRDGLLNDDPDPKNAAHALWAVQQRLAACVELLGELGHAEAAS